MRYVVQRKPTGWWIVDTTQFVNGIVGAFKRIEKHVSKDAAESACKRLNGICLHCERPLAECKIENPRDETFGSEYDDSDEE